MINVSDTDCSSGISRSAGLQRRPSLVDGRAQDYQPLDAVPIASSDRVDSCHQQLNKKSSDDDDAQHPFCRRGSLSICDDSLAGLNSRSDDDGLCVENCFSPYLHHRKRGKLSSQTLSKTNASLVAYLMTIVSIGLATITSLSEAFSPWIGHNIFADKVSIRRSDRRTRQCYSSKDFMHGEDCGTSSQIPLVAGSSSSRSRRSTSAISPPKRRTRLSASLSIDPSFPFHFRRGGRGGGSNVAQASSYGDGLFSADASGAAAASRAVSGTGNIAGTRDEEILLKYRQAEYRKMRREAKKQQEVVPSSWSFEALFPEPVWDLESIDKDLYSLEKRTNDVLNRRKKRRFADSIMRSYYGAGRTTNLMNVERAQRQNSELDIGGNKKNTAANVNAFVNEDGTTTIPDGIAQDEIQKAVERVLKAPLPRRSNPRPPKKKEEDPKEKNGETKAVKVTNTSTTERNETQSKILVDDVVRGGASTMNATRSESPSKRVMGGVVDQKLSRLVKDRIYGMRSSSAGQFQYYDTSLLDNSRAVQFTSNGRRIGRPLKVNLDKLNHSAKRAFRKHKYHEAAELYEQAIAMDPFDGRAYLGRAKCASQMYDVVTARKYLKAGLSRAIWENGLKSPYLLQALGVLEEKVGHLSQAESYYLQALSVRPCHAAAWVALGQLRTQRLKQGVQAGRICFQAAERELAMAGEPPSSHVYTAWASLEHKQARNYPKARQLYQKALEIDPKCSAAYLQLGVMEVSLENYDDAKTCFETVLKFDNRNSRVLQAYAIMESKRDPSGKNSRNVIDLFERALKVNPKDAGVLQAYSIYVANLGDVKAARKLLQRATKVDKRHAPVWQAWGVMEMRWGDSPDVARDVFQQGIWSCAQSSGGQSGGRYCARLWQAWGILESREGDYAAARRCFSRALDADERNVATITAWTDMEIRLGNHKDARAIFERSLKKFASPSSSDKITLWKAYERMEHRLGNKAGAQSVYNRYVRETLAANEQDEAGAALSRVTQPTANIEGDDSSSSIGRTNRKVGGEVEVITWNSKQQKRSGRKNNRRRKNNRKFGKEDREAKVWMNKGMIEGKMPLAELNKLNGLVSAATINNSMATQFIGTNSTNGGSFP